MIGMIGSKSDTASLGKCDRWPFFLLFTIGKHYSQKKLPRTCRVHLIKYICEDLIQFGVEMSKIFDLGKRLADVEPEIVTTSRSVYGRSKKIN